MNFPSLSELFFLSLYCLLLAFAMRSLVFTPGLHLQEIMNYLILEYFLKLTPTQMPKQTSHQITVTSFMFSQTCLFFSFTCLCYYDRTTFLSAMAMPTVYPPSTDHLRVTSDISYQHFICCRMGWGWFCFPSPATTDSTASTEGKNKLSPVRCLLLILCLLL